MPNIVTLASLTKQPHPQTPRATALVFEDPVSRVLEAHIRRVAPSTANVLVTGETGTGKELVARFVHDCSPRRGGPFVPVDCASFVETLVEAELFGHEKGAYTGATQARAGWFEAAEGGTIFLDEIGDLPIPLQSKLLRVLQAREVVRVGARRAIPVDARVIAASNVDLEGAICAGRFRPDLFYRLNVARIDLKPLRERPGDILPLAHYFLGLYAKQHGRCGPRLRPNAERVLLAYEWPGNIRELENVMHHAVLVAHDDEIVAPDLSVSPPLRAQPAAAGTRPRAPALRDAFGGLFDAGAASLFERVTTELVHAALDRCEGNQVRTARLLGVSRNVLRSHLARMGVIAGRRRSSAGGGPKSGSASAR